MAAVEAIAFAIAFPPAHGLDDPLGIAACGLGIAAGTAIALLVDDALNPRLVKGDARPTPLPTGFVTRQLRRTSVGRMVGNVQGERATRPPGPSERGTSERVDLSEPRRRELLGITAR
jgi:hypothetical protein